MTTLPRLFLVAPADCSGSLLLSCVQAAAASGDIASLVIHPQHIAQTSALQALNIAVLLNELSPDVKTYGCDGVHLPAEADLILEGRRELGQGMIVGAYCATSRDAAMSAGEQGADYIAFSQKSQVTGEPLLKWWSDLFALPSVAFDPISADELAMILPQQPDFIRPGDAMWQSPELATEVIGAVMKKLAQCE